MQRSGILQNSRIHLPACNSSSTIASIQQTLPQLDYNPASKAVETREALQRCRTSSAAPTHQRFVANQWVINKMVTQPVPCIVLPHPDAFTQIHDPKAWSKAV